MIRDASVYPRFLREGCIVMGRNARDLLRLAGQEVTVPAVMAIILSSPEGRAREEPEVGYDCWPGMTCWRALRLAQDRCFGTPDEPRCRELLDYFVKYVPEWDLPARLMIEDAFLGVLAGIGQGGDPVGSDRHER